MSDRLKIIQRTGEEVLPLPRVVLLGVPRTAEYSGALQSLAAITPEGALTTIPALSDLAELFQRGAFPDLIVVVQTWSDEFPFTDFLKLPGFGPFSRVLCCYGPWCVSDGRSRQDWPLALRIPVEHFEAALRREMKQLLNPDRSSAPTPWTAGREEIFRDRQPPLTRTAPVGARRVIRVISADRKLTELWQELVRKAGFPTAVEGAAGGGQLVLWDVDPLSDEQYHRWDEFRRRFPTAIMIALTGFAAQDVIDDLLGRGAAAVISKLLPLDSLLEEIEKLIAAAAARAGS